MISVIASSETVSIVKFSSLITNSVTNSDVGIATITTSALRHERRKNSIAMPVNATPSSSVCTTLEQLLLGEIGLDVEHAELHVGDTAPRSPGSAACTAREAVTSLAPAPFSTFSVIAGTPETYEYTRLGS